MNIKYHTAEERDEAKRLRNRRWRQAHRRKAPLERHAITCPDCGQVREVGTRYWEEIRSGRCGARCIKCANIARDKGAPRRTVFDSPLCRHCGIRNISRPRGMCRRCYDAPGLRELYPPTSKFARRGVGTGSGSVTLPDAPTTAAPGTPEKVAVLEERAKLKQSLFHPFDAGYEGDPRPLEWLREHRSEAVA